MLNEEKEILQYIKEAFSLRSQELYKPAVEMLYKALSLDNDNIEVLFQLGELYALMHNCQRAAGYLEQVLAKNPEHVESLQLIRKIHENNGQLKDSMKYAQKLYDLMQTPENLKEIVKLAGKLKMTDKLFEYQNSQHCSEEVLYEIANALYENGKSPRQKKFLKNTRIRTTKI